MRSFRGHSHKNGAPFGPLTLCRICYALPLLAIPLPLSEHKHEPQLVTKLNFVVPSLRAVYSTKATGTLPAQWSALTNLEYLDLGSDVAEFDAPHSFSGPLPPQWSTLNKLNVLYVLYLPPCPHSSPWLSPSSAY
jgi:hypothetical protein